MKINYLHLSYIHFKGQQQLKNKTLKRFCFFHKLLNLVEKHHNNGIFNWINFLLCIFSSLVPLTEYKIVGQFKEGMNVLGLVMFSVILGATIGKMGERGKPIQDFLVSLSEAMMIITRWVIW
jgi:Na+/H+-dicarboxylate symporter